MHPFQHGVVEGPGTRRTTTSASSPIRTESSCLADATTVWKNENIGIVMYMMIYYASSPI